MTESAHNVYVFYQYFHPDDVVSAVHFTELSTGLTKRGWNVTAFPCNRSCRNDSVDYPREGEFAGVAIERLWRPAWRQSSSVGRILNALWMIVRWSMLAAEPGRNPSVVIVGTDPILSVLVAIAWRFFKPRTVVVHWCFDLYPEAAYADNVLSRGSVAARLMHGLLKKAYRACDLVVDIGCCMRGLILLHDKSLRMTTITPWALEEPADVLPVPAVERQAMFGDSPFGLLYSGTFGRAHSFQTLLDLARLLRADDIHLTFSIRGNREEALRAAIAPEDTNIHFAPFAEAKNLPDRLACADVHAVTLREEWTGTVVPSKFFGALAIGRPVLFCGDSRSAVAQWIEQYDLGWVLTPANLTEVAESMRRLSKDKLAMQQKEEHCHKTYRAFFSREIGLDEWHRQLVELVSSSPRSA
jgi:glycosyltransferase involved in cell wall biosynthesis